MCRWTPVGEIEDCEVELIVLRAAALRLSEWVLAFAAIPLLDEKYCRFPPPSPIDCIEYCPMYCRYILG